MCLAMHDGSTMMKQHLVPTMFRNPTASPIGLRPVRVRAAAFSLLALCALSLPGSVSAAIRIHGPGEVIESWSFTSGGRLFFQDPDGDLHKFVTDIQDQIITNKGKGSFFTPDTELVRRALEAIAYPLDDLAVDVFVLPYPRRGTLVSSAGRASVYLSPGVVPYTDYQVHALIAHEVGHLVHRQTMADDDRAGWDRYRRLRGIEDRSVYNSGAAHKDRPHEIFAEDFRYLFGGPLATYSGSIENRSLVLPDQVPGLESFLLGLSGRGATAHGLPVAGRLQMFPNPTQGGVTISLANEVAATGSEPVELSVFDVQGRLVHRETLPAGGGLRWEGSVDTGEPASPGLYFVRVRRGRGHWVGKVLVSR